MNKPEILHEDSEVIVVAKPAGWLVHEDGKTIAPTIVAWVLDRNPEIRGVGEEQALPDGVPIERSGIVHRLDRDTSGVLLIAKTQAAYDHLKKQFHDRLATKEYRAMVYGYFKDTGGVIDKPIGRSRKDPRLRSAERGASGKLRDAETEWKLITQNAEYAYVRVFPKTGRTHQIRVHLKAIGHPIVGDVLYASKAIRERASIQNSPLMLHAYQITFTHPSGTSMTVSAPLPQDFSHTLHLEFSETKIQ